MLKVGDEVELRNGTVMIVTYVGENEVEGFTPDGWVIRPLMRNIVGRTGNHYDLPITERKGNQL